MSKNILSPHQVFELVSANKYPVNEATKFLARCIDGRYPNDKDLPALAIAGAAAGELAILAAAANEYGFEVHLEKALDALAHIVGGTKNLRGHTDDKSDPTVLLSGCGHVRSKNSDPDAYGLTTEQTAEILKLFAKAEAQGAKEIKLEGNHREGAVLMITGRYGVYPQYHFKTGHGDELAQVFIHHQTLVDERHREWAKKLVENKAVKLFEGCDDEYLYEVISSTTEDHLMETARRLAKDLPIYAVKFAQDGTFELEERGKVE